MRYAYQCTPNNYIMANIFYKRNYYFNFQQSFLTQIGSQFLVPGIYNYSIYSIENKNFWGVKSYETTIELRDFTHNLIKRKIIKEDSIDYNNVVLLAYDSLFYQSLIPECIEYLLKNAIEYINKDFCYFPRLDNQLYYSIDGYKIGDHLNTSDFSVKIPVKWEFEDHPNKEIVEKKHIEIAPLSGYTLCVDKNSATILYGKNDVVLYTFSDPKKIFSMFCYSIIRLDKFLLFQ